jgi:putative transcriptional regulator
MRVDELIDEFPDCDAEVFFGGPVQTNSLHYIHNVGDLLEDSVKVMDGVYWGGDYNKLKFLVENGLIKSSNIRFFVGYSGWSSGQLHEELELGSWIVTEMFANYVFKVDSKQLWSRIMYDKGDAFTVIAQMQEYSDWN